MKILLRVAAALSFGCCLVAGLLILGNTVGSESNGAFMLAAVGLVLMGAAFFAGGTLLVAAEKLGRKPGGA